MLNGKVSAKPNNDGGKSGMMKRNGYPLKSDF
jgi:hypothetical protein